MARHCPDCKAEMEHDGVHAWCPAAGCDFKGYVVVRTGKVLREETSEPNDPSCVHCGYEKAPHETMEGRMCSDCLSACCDV